MGYYKIAKIAYCTEGDQWGCHNCQMCTFLEEHNFDHEECHLKLIGELVKIIDEYKEFDTFLAAHGCFPLPNQVQQRITTTVDKFNSIITDLKNGQAPRIQSDNTEGLITKR